MSKQVLIAPNAFKGTLKAMTAAELIASVYQKLAPDLKLDLCPIADGGDGTCELLTDILKLEKKVIWTLDAVGKPVLGSYGLDQPNETAYVDVSSVSGLGVLSGAEQNVRLTSTFGTGKLIASALANGAKTIVLGLGGSATIDLGVGILQALGLVFLNEKGRSLHPFTPDILKKVKHIQLNKPLPKVNFICLCDVNNPFLGPQGAIPVFGPQKGIQPNDFATLELEAKELLTLFFNKSKRAIEDQPGFGAAGGISFGLSFFFDVALEMGARFFFEQVKMEEKLKDSEVVICGEGRYDSQSAGGKGVFELKQMMDLYGVPGVLISSGEEGKQAGFREYIQLPDLDFSSGNIHEQAARNLRQSFAHYLIGASSPDQIS